MVYWVGRSPSASLMVMPRSENFSHCAVVMLRFVALTTESVLLSRMVTWLQLIQALQS